MTLAFCCFCCALSRVGKRQASLDGPIRFRPSARHKAIRRFFADCRPVFRISTLLRLRVSLRRAGLPNARIQESRFRMHVSAARSIPGPRRQRFSPHTKVLRTRGKVEGLQILKLETNTVHCEVTGISPERDRLRSFPIRCPRRLHFGTITAFVPGPDAAQYGFTSALPVAILKAPAPKLMPLLDSPGEGARR